jgi:hypothetical protein
VNLDQAKMLEQFESADVPRIIKGFHEEQRALKVCAVRIFVVLLLRC